MSWTDDISDTDEMLPWFGSAGVIIFVVICIFAFMSYSDVMKVGIPMTIVDIGTCRSADCAIRVKDNTGRLFQKETGSKVFVGDVVKCGDNRCYKD